MLQEADVMRMWPQAKQGDPVAVAQVVAWVFETYKYRIREFYSRDPSLDREDIEQEFMEGICRGLRKLDSRGNPLYHLSQRGVWAVMTKIRSARKSRHGALEGGVYLDSIERLMELHGEEDTVDPRSYEVFELVIERNDAKTRLTRILANCDLSDSTERALRVILSGEAGDPNELGFGKRLATVLGVSPQRASQMLAKIRNQMAAADKHNQESMQ